MRHRAPFLLFAALALGFLSPAVLFAELPMPPPAVHGLTELASSAPAILIGRCIDTQAAWDSSGRVIHTTATYEVQRWLKGDEPVPQVKVQLLGGTVGDITQVAVGAPVAVLGERVALFLAPGAGDGFTIVGWNRGKLPVTQGPGGAEVVLVSADPEPLPLRQHHHPPASTPGLAIPVHLLDSALSAAKEVAR